MLHNSLFVRDELRAKNNDPFAKERRDPHRNVRRDPSRRLGVGEVELDGEWRVTVGLSVGLLETETLDSAAEDLRDFLARMGVGVNSQAPGEIRLHENSGIEPGAFMLTAAEGRIAVSASDAAGLWAGVVYMEKEMSVRCAPIVPLGCISRRPQWRMQIGQAPYGANFLVPDFSPELVGNDAFRMLIHYGVNGMLLYGDMLCYTQSELFPELSHPDAAENVRMLRDAARRAAKYGVKLYFVAIGAKLDAAHPLFARRPDIRGAKLERGLSGVDKTIHCLCSSHPDVLRFHAECWTRLVRQVPELGGIILIVGGEAYNHCYMRADKAGLAEGVKTNCPRCRQLYPEDAVSTLVEAVSTAVHGINPQVEVFVWEYSAQMWTSDEDQLELIRRLPSDVSLLTTLDKGPWLQKRGYKKLIRDYSVEYAGPAEKLLVQTDAARRRGLPVSLKLETAVGLECLFVPYVPTLAVAANKWDNAAKLRPRAVIQSWCFFGMWGSRSEELGWWAAWRPELTKEEVIRRLAERDFADYAPGVMKVWERMGETVRHLPYIGPAYRGPEFLGPAHPLFFRDPPATPELFMGGLYLPEREESLANHTVRARHSLLRDAKISFLQADAGADPWEAVIGEYAQAATCAKQALDTVAALCVTVMNDRRAEVRGPVGRMLHEERWIVEAMYRTFAATKHTLEFLYYKRRFGATRSSEDMAAMLRVAQDELDNAEAARRLYEEAPWLDVKNRTEGGNFQSSLDMIDAKIRSLTAEIDQFYLKE